MRKTILIIEDDLIQLEALKKLVMEVEADVTVYAVSDAFTAYGILMENMLEAAKA